MTAVAAGARIVAGSKVERLDATGHRRLHLELLDVRVDLIEPALGGVDGAFGGAEIFDARALDDELRARLRLESARGGLGDVFLARAVLELVDGGLRRVALRDGRSERRVGVVGLGLRDGLLRDEIARALRVELRLVDRDLRLREPRARCEDLLVACAGLRFLQRGRGGRGVRPRLGNLLGPRAGLELLQVRLGLLEGAERAEALRGEISLLEHEEDLSGFNRVALFDLHLFHASADARAEVGDARFDRAAPLVRLPREVHAVRAVRRREERDHDDRNRDAALLRRDGFVVQCHVRRHARILYHRGARAH